MDVDYKRIETYNKYKVGDVVVIKKEPKLWNSGVINNCPLKGRATFPFKGTINDIGRYVVGEEILNACDIGGYGFDLDVLIKARNIRIYQPTEEEKQTITNGLNYIIECLQ